MPVSLLREACRLCTAFARTNGASGLVSWVSQGVRELLADSGYCASSPVCGIGVPVASDIKPAELDNLNWWFMSGDTDFL